MLEFGVRLCCWSLLETFPQSLFVLIVRLRWVLVVVMGQETHEPLLQFAFLRNGTLEHCPTQLLPHRFPHLQAGYSKPAAKESPSGECQ